MRYGSLAEAARGDAYANHCVNGKCSNCGECCADLLPLTDQELQRIKEYVKEHGVTENRQAPFWDWKAVDFTCPFRNQRDRKCEIYPARPYICRTFICTKTKKDAMRDRDLIHAGRDVRSLRWEIFGNSETIRVVAAIMMQHENIGC